MSELERYTPPEARQETKPEKSEKPNLNPQTVRNIQEGPPLPVGTFEKPEIQRSPETSPEKQGDQIKPPFSDDPNKTASDDTATDDKATKDQGESQ